MNEKSGNYSVMMMMMMINIYHMKMDYTIVLSLILSCCLFHPVIGQNEDQQSSSQSPRPVNICKFN